MNRAVTLLLFMLLIGCAPVANQAPPAPQDDAGKLLVEGIHALLVEKSPAQLDDLINNYPDSPHASAAKEVLKLQRSSKGKPDVSELEKLRQENLQLREDLEKLRQLLIKSEKQAS